MSGMDTRTHPASAESGNHSPTSARILRGFTLIELLVVIAIVGIAAAIGVPAMSTLIERNTVSGQVDTFIGSFNLARSEAIRRTGTVVMCNSENAESATEPSCSGGGHWERGWIVFLDRDNNLIYKPDSGDVLLSVQGPFPKSGGISKTGNAALRFLQTGVLGDGMGTVTVQAASQTMSRQRCIVISKAGRTRIVEGGGDGCS